MLNGLRVAALIPVFNEESRLPGIIARMPRDLVDSVLVVDDASTDGTYEAAKATGAEVIHKERNEGPGPAIRDGIAYLMERGIDVVVPLAANGKHDPREIPRLVEPIANEGYDLVRGSRHLAGAGHSNMPWHRLALIHLFTFLLSLMLQSRVTDGTGGFQAYRLAILDNPSINLWQPWLRRYEVETYLFVKTLRLGYRWKEVPVTITYPRRGLRYTRARAFVDWWAYFRPVVLVGLGLRS